MTGIDPGQGASWLRMFLAAQDAACPSCGYNLRGLAGEACPECNQRLVLAVGLAEPRLGWYLAAVIANALGLGFSLLLAGFIVLNVLMRTRGGPPPDMFPAVGVPLLLQGAMMVVLVRGGRRIRRASTPSRIMLAAGCAVLTITNLVVFTFTVR